ncbi:MAG: hypothetical protein US70_C0010G0030 [Parcubacteria group bacterium GW2011_GWD2_38_11]|nr:MAG: hypothetical protein US70_C0010G0030 [Parcubacteria group bacterium GW2011_GWD2_38_11]
MSFDLRNSKPLHSANMPAESNDNQHNQKDPGEERGAGKILHQWRAPEFEVYEKSARWYFVFVLFIGAMIVYALFTNSPIMAITFILLGIVGYIHLQKDPRVISFSITSKGVIADKEMYLYENIHSFWIFYDPPHTKTISLHTKASMLPLVHIPLRDQNPVKLRELLMKNIPEIKQDPGLIDAIERVLHI